MARVQCRGALSLKGKDARIAGHMVCAAAILLSTKRKSVPVQVRQVVICSIFGQG
jgi:hypothetical protein